VGFFRGVFVESGMGHDGLEILFGDHSGFGGNFGLSIGRYDTTKLTISVYSALSWFWATNLYNERTYLHTTASKIKFPKSTLLSPPYSPKSLRHIKIPRPVCQQLRW
jgi:hypothetical protein